MHASISANNSEIVHNQYYVFLQTIFLLAIDFTFLSNVNLGRWISYVSASIGWECSPPPERTFIAMGAYKQQ